MVPADYPVRKHGEAGSQVVGCPAVLLMRSAPLVGRSRFYELVFSAACGDLVDVLAADADSPGDI